jgi:hypothetical protein
MVEPLPTTESHRRSGPVDFSPDGTGLARVATPVFGNWSNEIMPNTFNQLVTDEQRSAINAAKRKNLLALTLAHEP